MSLGGVQLKAALGQDKTRASVFAAVVGHELEAGIIHNLGLGRFLPRRGWVVSLLVTALKALFSAYYYIVWQVVLQRGMT